MPIIPCHFLVLLVVGFLWIPGSKITVAADASAEREREIEQESIESNSSSSKRKSNSNSNSNSKSNNNNNNNESESEETEFVCNVYLAPSTLPGTGLGMYAGANGFKAGETITKTLGDHIISVPDLKITHSDTGLYDKSHDDMTKYFLWDQYTWNANALGIGIHHISNHDNEIASPGFGAAANSFMDFVNVEEGGCKSGLLPAADSNTNSNSGDSGDTETDSNNNSNSNDNRKSNTDYHIHRSKDPGAGAFTQYHSREAWADIDIAPNSEFFVSYGNDWFLDRAWRLGTIPVQGDHDDAELFWEKFNKDFLGRSFVKPIEFEDDGDHLSTEEPQPPIEIDAELVKIHREFWDTIVATHIKNSYTESRIFAALPKDAELEDYEAMLTHPEGYKAIKRDKMRRDPEWLAENGVCADAVRIGRSTLPSQQAGHGAFANTSFEKGKVIMSAPLIHIPDKAILDTYYKNHELERLMEAAASGEFDDDEEEEEDFENDPDANLDEEILAKFEPSIGYIKTGEQLLLNYVFGHRDSTMLLSPYGPGVQLINHNQTLVNVRLQWAEPHRSNHHPELLDKSVAYIQETFPLGSVLGLEIVATKPIQKDEEIFLDYGDEWEEAWQEHLEQWEPLRGSDHYVSAIDLNTLPKYTSKPIPNVYGTQNRKDVATNNGATIPFPRTAQLRMSAAWRNSTLRNVHGDDAITEQMMWAEYDYDSVEAIFRTGNHANKHKFSVEDPEIFERLSSYQQDEVREIREREKANVNPNAATESNDEPKTSDVDSNTDQSLYTVVVRLLVEYDDWEISDADANGEVLPRYTRITVRDVPRRGLKFEDLSYTTDQFLSNAFRDYIRIPDDIFPDAWKNIEFPQQKHAHYWKYRTEDWRYSNADHDDGEGDGDGDDDDDDNDDDDDDDDNYDTIVVDDVNLPMA